MQGLTLAGLTQGQGSPEARIRRKGVNLPPLGRVGAYIYIEIFSLCMYIYIHTG